MKLKKFNEDHVETISIDLHDFLISKALEIGLHPDEVIDFDDLDNFLMDAFSPFFNSEKNYN